MISTRPGCVGIDEAGRGPLAGPVVVAAVMLPQEFDLTGLDDSKKLTARKREVLAERIKSGADWWIEIVPASEIDRLNILRATLTGMAQSAFRVPGWEQALVDGSSLPPELAGRAEAVIGGDAKIAEIAAASILAKTTRDALMVKLDAVHPGYGFSAHFGYPTPAHREALMRLGPCPEHRRSFAPVREALFLHGMK